MKTSLKWDETTTVRLTKSFHNEMDKDDLILVSLCLQKLMFDTMVLQFLLYNEALYCCNALKVISESSNLLLCFKSDQCYLAYFQIK